MRSFIILGVPSLYKHVTAGEEADAPSAKVETRDYCNGDSFIES